jgi:hypothetical protein
MVVQEAIAREMTMKTGKRKTFLMGFMVLLLSKGNPPSVEIKLFLGTSQRFAMLCRLGAAGFAHHQNTSRIIQFVVPSRS